MSTNVDSVSASTITTTATKCHSHILTIQGYSQTKLFADGTSVESKTFETGGCTWYILFYPNGASAAAADRICLGLALADSCDRPVCVHAQFTIVPHHGRPAPATTYCNSCRLTFRRIGDNRRGPPSPLITRAELEESEYLVDDGFAVRCDVTVVNARWRSDVVVQPRDLERAGIACSCKDQLCKRRHASSWESSKSETTPTPPQRRRRAGIKAAWFRLVRRTLP
ncbi:hypothetical protein VPH35_091857 [Triticum aestivum]|uniref:MATH domain-containing protein n=1 Tax=Triticum turgidum subsp. durum TaxID=4567 RepID=A0A9R0XEV2_TRITD|nr:unnamed protein product [Triticum turgidum subsp. durum]